MHATGKNDGEVSVKKFSRLGAELVYLVGVVVALVVGWGCD
jgi:hypothetical protein